MINETHVSQKKGKFVLERARSSQGGPRGISPKISVVPAAILMRTQHQREIANEPVFYVGLQNGGGAPTSFFFDLWYGFSGKPRYAPPKTAVFAIRIAVFRLKKVYSHVKG